MIEISLGLVVAVGLVCLIIWKVSDAYDRYKIGKYDQRPLTYKVQFPHPIYASIDKIKRFVDTEWRIEVLEKYNEICADFENEETEVNPHIRKLINDRINCLVKSATV